MHQENCHKSDDTERFVRLQSDAQRRMFSFIQTLVFDWANAEEVLQEANVTIWKKREQFDLDTDFMHWANRIAYYEVLKFRTKNRKHRVLSDESLEHIAADMLKMEDSLQKQSKILEGCIKKLPEKDRKIIHQRYFEETSIQSIADILGRSARAVHYSLQRIRASLRGCIRQTLAAEGQD